MKTQKVTHGCVMGFGPAHVLTFESLSDRVNGPYMGQLRVIVRDKVVPGTEMPLEGHPQTGYECPVCGWTMREGVS